MAPSMLYPHPMEQSAPPSPAQKPEMLAGKCHTQLLMTI